MNSSLSYTVDIEGDLDFPEQVKALLAAAVKMTLIMENITPPAVVAVLLTNDQRMGELNLKHRGIDAATDVLSFPAGDPLPGMEEAAPHVGDIVISLPYASRQAMTRDHAPHEEMQLLAVHGTLHLLGYDHADEVEKQRMWQAQNRIMAKLSLDHVLPTEGAHAQDRVE